MCHSFPGPWNQHSGVDLTCLKVERKLIEECAYEAFFGFKPPAALWFYKRIYGPIDCQEPQNKLILAASPGTRANIIGGARDKLPLIQR